MFAEREPGELDELAGLPELRLEGLSDSPRGCVARVGDQRAAGRARARADRRRDAWESARAARVAARVVAGRAGGRLRPNCRAAAAKPYRRELPAESRASPRRQPAAALGGRGRADRRSDAVVASGRSAWPRSGDGGACGRRGLDHSRRQGHLSPPSPALGDLPRRLSRRATGRASSSGGGHRSRPRSGSPRLAPGPRDARAGRGRRRGARALSGPGASTRRAGCGGRVPRAGREAHPGACAPCPA